MTSTTELPFSAVTADPAQPFVDPSQPVAANAAQIADTDELTMMRKGERQSINMLPEQFARVDSAGVYESLDPAPSATASLVAADGQVLGRLALQDEVESLPVYETLDNPAGWTKASLVDADGRELDYLMLFGDQVLVNAHTLRRTMNKLAQLTSLQVATLRIMIFGDSWVQQGFTWGRVFAAMLWRRFGKAAAGFLPSANGSGADPAVVTHAYGNWTANDNRNRFYPTPDMRGRESLHAGDNVTIVPDAAEPAPDKVLAFFVGSADAVVECSVPGRAPVNVATPGAGKLIIVEIPTAGLAPGGWPINVEVKAGTVTYGGAFADSDRSGVIVSFCGFGGTTSADWVSIDPVEWQKGVAATKPDLCGFMLGTNDKLMAISPALAARNDAELIRRMRAAVPSVNGVPTTDIIAIMPANIASAPGTVGREYARALYAEAKRSDFAVLNLAKAFGDDPATYRSWFKDDNHPLDNNAFIAAWLMRAFGIAL